MSCQAIHSQLLFVLLTCYCNLTFYLILARQHSYYILSADLSEATSRKVESEFEGFKVFISLIIHAFSTICIICCVVINNVDKVAKRVPSIVVVAVLIFVLFFNIIAIILLFVHNGPKNRKVKEIQACAMLSTAASMLMIATIGYFAWRPPRKALIIHDVHKAPKRKTKKSGYRATVTAIPASTDGSKETKGTNSREMKAGSAEPVHGSAEPTQPEYENLEAINRRYSMST
ncbi:hypothetical protein Y032_0130g1535 [Ancylostoma ceylanicum]|uniref:Uncharacterized protein n=1 Tax=Ancylostoma ceylanicum TaxID=53326 RepID=A0A016T7J0_9BILA|nr:hypothetical protein Y032_0130g1535 [Ancylostoma ceylanicum]